jgi:hypothetical protein
MTELRVWLDRNNYVPVSFDIMKQPRGVLVRMVFAARLPCSTALSPEHAGI